MKQYYLPFLAIVMIASCGSPSEENMSEINGAGLAEVNPPAEGFDAEGSDPEAIAIADGVMEAMGGRQAWDETRYISWNFLGRRSLLWDKQTGDVRIDIPADTATYIVNVNQDTGSIMRGGAEVVQPDSVAKYVEQAKKIWVNDSYWLVMPYKLKDSGVTLNYVGEDTTQSGEVSEVLELRFANTGFTPQNRYEVYVSRSDSLVKEWAYYKESELDTPNLVTPWDDYKEYNGIMLSGNRGRMTLSEISVSDTLPQTDAFVLQP